MARPIEPTPKLKADDADSLLRDLENVCAPSEAARRISWAEKQLAEMTRPKGSPTGDRPNRR